MFNEFQNPRLAEALRRAYGEQLEISTFAPELAAHIILENDRFENRLLQGLRYWTTGNVIITASVGNVSRIQIHNPPSSGILVIVEGFVVRAAVGTDYVVTRDGALAGTPTANLATDTRIPPSAASRKVASLNRIDNSLPALSGEIMSRRTVVAGQDAIFNFLEGGPEQPLVLVPNTVCEVINNTQNSALTALGFGYERQARPEE